MERRARFGGRAVYWAPVWVPRGKAVGNCRVVGTCRMPSLVQWSVIVCCMLPPASVIQQPLSSAPQMPRGPVGPTVTCRSWRRPRKAT